MKENVIIDIATGKEERCLVHEFRLDQHVSYILAPIFTQNMLVYPENGFLNLFSAGVDISLYRYHKVEILDPMSLKDLSKFFKYIYKDEHEIFSFTTYLEEISEGIVRVYNGWGFDNWIETVKYIFDQYRNVKPVVYFYGYLSDVLYMGYFPLHKSNECFGFTLLSFNNGLNEDLWRRKILKDRSLREHKGIGLVLSGHFVSEELMFEIEKYMPWTGYDIFITHNNLFRGYLYEIIEDMNYMKKFLKHLAPSDDIYIFGINAKELENFIRGFSYCLSSLDYTIIKYYGRIFRVNSDTNKVKSRLRLEYNLPLSYDLFVQGYWPLILSISTNFVEIIQE